MVKTCVLVTGGAGYIGSHAALACLEAGYRVVVIDDLSNGERACVPPEAAFEALDVADTERVGALMARERVEAVLHYAGSIVVPDSIARPGEYYENNTVKSLALACLAAKAGVSAFVFSSTAAVYAPGAAGAIAEDSPKAPLSPYGASKLMTERMLADIGAAHDLSVGILRYFNVAGADPQGRTGQCTPNATHLIKVAAQTACGRRDVLPVYGADYDTPDGSCVRDYIHVSDLADAHVLALDHLLAGGAGFTFNCGYGRGASVFEVIRAMEKAAVRPLPVTLRPRRPGDAAALVSDPARLKAALPWRPKFANLDAIVASALAWEEALGADGRRRRA